jgi:hypothetical protein
MNIPKMKSNFGLGPRTGNMNSEDKRSAFKAGKAERAGLADSINTAFAMRSPTSQGPTKTAVNPTLEGVASDVKPKKFKK